MQEGDTLWGLAETHLGSGERWPEIYELNQEGVGADPNAILPAQALVLPPSQEQIRQHVDQVKQGAGGEAGAGERGAEGDQEDGQEQEQAPDGGQDGGQAGAADSANGSAAVSGATGSAGPGTAGAGAGAGSDMTLPPWEVVGQSFAWDQEIAQHDVWAEAAAEVGGAPGASAGAATAAVPSREELVTQALAGGAWTGFTSGLASIAIDTAINAGSSKIPMLAGFVELGQAAYGLATDPKGWGQGKLDGLLGNGPDGSNKYLEGLKKLGSGDPLDMIEGAIDLGDGIKSTIDTLSSICWIIAGLGFILSWIPGMQWLIPFVALAAKWGSLLGTIGTMMGAVMSVLRMMLIPLRSIDILYWESDPQAAQAKAERLQQDTQAFVQTWTERAGDTARKHIAGSPHRSRGGEQGGRRSAPPAGQRPSALSRALSLTGGALKTGLVTATGAGQLSRGKFRKVRGEVRNTAAATGQTFRGGQSTGQRIHNLESRNISVYVGSFMGVDQREYANRRLGQSADPATEQGQLGHSRQRLADAEADLAQAKQERREADRNLRERQRDVDAAHERLRQVQESNQPARQHQEQQVAEARVLADSYAQDVRSVEGQMAYQRQVLDMARNAHATYPDGVGADGVPFRAKVQQAEQELGRLESELQMARTGHQEAVDLHQQEQAHLERVLQVEHDAQADVDRATTERNQGNTRNSQAAQDLRRAYGERKDARDDFDSVDEITEEARKNYDARMEMIRSYVWWRDVAGKGADGGHLYGHNQGSGATGFATGLAVEAAGAAVDAIGGADEEQDEQGEQAAQPAEGGPDYSALIQEKIAEIAGVLPAPPLEVPDQVDGAACAMEELEAEEEALTAEKQAALEAAALGTASLEEIAGTRTLIEGGYSAAQGVHGEADVLEQKQDEMASQAGELQSQSSSASGEAGEGDSMISGFVSKFIELMGRVPSDYVGNPGEGAQGARELARAGEMGPQATQAGEQTAAAASDAAATFRGQTAAVRGEVDGASAQLDGLCTDVDARESQAHQGLGEVEQAEADIDAELAEIEAEKQRLAGEHGAAVEAGSGWASSHQSVRQGELAELEALVSLAEAARQGENE